MVPTGVRARARPHRLRRTVAQTAQVDAPELFRGRLIGASERREGQAA